MRTLTGTAATAALTLLLMLTVAGCQFLGDQDMTVRADFSIIHGTEDDKETDE